MSKEDHTQDQYQTVGLYFENWLTESEFCTPARTITETNIIMFAGLSGDFTAAHVDLEFAKRTPSHTRTAQGMLVAAIASGLRFQTRKFEGTMIGGTEIDSKFLSPAKVGDTIHCRIIPLECKPSKKPDRGIVKYCCKTVNQDGVTVMEQEVTIVVLRQMASQDEWQMANPEK